MCQHVIRGDVDRAYVTSDHQVNTPKPEQIFLIISGQYNSSHKLTWGGINVQD